MRPHEVRFMAECMPRFPRYEHWMENRYRATCHDGTLFKENIERNIKLILAGEFDDHK